MTENNDTEKVRFLPPEAKGWLEIDAASSDEEKSDDDKKNKSTLNELLLSSMQMQNIIVLAGSGTSLEPVGGPSMLDLWQACTKDGDSYTNVANTVFSSVNYDVSTGNSANIEELLSLCEAYIQINSDNQGVVPKFIKDCKAKILDACNFEAFLDAHKTFIHRLSRRRVRDSRLKVFTTNYDTCFEDAAGKQGVVVIDGFSYTQPRIYGPLFFDYDIIRRSTTQDNTQNYLEGVFQLYKLHGSINWERKENGSIEVDTATAQGVCMIFPARGKYQQSYVQPHLELMARYLSSLREPNTCLVITGFGFNDDHLSEPIIAAIKTNPSLKVIIADSKAEDSIQSPANDYWKTLRELNASGEDVWLINATFQQFAALIPDLRSLTPAQHLVKSIKGLVTEQ